MKTIALISVCILFSLSSVAQTRVVKGKLITFNTYPVQNVEVASKKAKSTVMTDSLGQFEIVCNEKDVIMIKAKVFQSFNKKVKEDDDYISANLIFRDTPENREIATGLGYITHEQLTFALAHMANENNDFCNYTDVFSLVRGKFPGVQIKTNSLGTEGIFVRGDKSIYGNNEAIYVVDGVRVGDISFVNPCEMATIDVLKDGGAALYGSQASNGVVVIETKGHRSNQ
ncbi:MAG: TonB-dependent receptor plug domain-containing protein [Bacteroidales bacterium]|nr:TonB-dependent receptor plug domain-containing protein [Bacteroidales bacterium]